MLSKLENTHEQRQLVNTARRHNGSYIVLECHGNTPQDTVSSLVPSHFPPSLPHPARGPPVVALLRGCVRMLVCAFACVCVCVCLYPHHVPFLPFRHSPLSFSLITRLLTLHPPRIIPLPGLHLIRFKWWRA